MIHYLKKQLVAPGVDISHINIQAILIIIVFTTLIFAHYKHLFTFVCSNVKKTMNMTFIITIAREKFIVMTFKDPSSLLQ